MLNKRTLKYNCVKYFIMFCLFLMCGFIIFGLKNEKADAYVYQEPGSGYSFTAEITVKTSDGSIRYTSTDKTISTHYVAASDTISIKLTTSGASLSYPGFWLYVNDVDKGKNTTGMTTNSRTENWKVSDYISTENDKLTIECYFWRAAFGTTTEAVYGYNFKIDSQAPNVTFYSYNKADGNTYYYKSNSTVYFSDSRSGIDKVEIWKNGAAFKNESMTSYYFQENGKFEIKATDKTGNTSSLYTVYFDNRSLNGSFTQYTGDTISGNILYTKGDAIQGITFTYETSNANQFERYLSIKHNGNVVSSSGYYTNNNGVVTLVRGNKGLYQITLSDIIGSSITYSVYNDNSPVNITLTGGATPNGIYTSKNIISVAWDNSSYEAPVASVTVQKKYIGESNSTSAYSSTSNVGNIQFAGEENKHIIYTAAITDKCGNVSTKTFHVDREAPSNKVLPSITNQDITFNATDKGVVKQLYYRYGSSGTYLNTTSSSVNIAATISNNGAWYFFAEDDVGNTSTPITCIIDTIAPTHKSLPQYTNQNIVFGADDINGVAKLYYRFGSSGNYNTATSQNFIVSAAAANCGVWYFYAEDVVGNKSTVETSTMSIINTFGNQDIIKNSYKSTSWYKVTLPARIFTISGKDIAGTYTFSNYESALSFAIIKETEFRCAAVPGGWIYVSATNESVSQIYTDKNTLDLAIRKYAVKYISEQQKFSLNLNNYYTPVNDNGIIGPEGLTRQELPLPAYLSGYLAYNLYICSGTSFTFNKIKLDYATVPSSVSLKFIANDIGLVSQETFTIPYNTTIKATLNTSGKYKQGYYLVTEQDAAGNIENYLIYLDLESPVLLANATKANNQSVINFTTDFATEFTGTFYYITFEIQALLDNADSAFLCVYISGKGIDQIFLSGEELPILCYENGYVGKYTISVYDRSKNRLDFDIMIAGADPGWSYSSLNNDTKMTVTITTNGDKNNSIVSVYLYKISYDGIYTELAYDDDGIQINFTSLTYVFRTGGKYAAKIIDLYGRVVETDPIFYLKGLPTGTLTGVGASGRTNRDVTFKYSGNASLIVYVYDHGVKRVFTDYVSNYQNNTNTYIIIFTANENYSYEYLLFLYDGMDMGLFVEYKFEIDCIIGNVYIYNNATHDMIAQDSATNNPFYLTWGDTLSVRYYTSSTIGGEIGSVPYTKGTVLKSDNLYYFTVQDDVGNVLKFTIYLKTKVNYKIEGEYKTLSDRIISNKHLIITILDPYSLFEVSSNNDYTFINGSPILYDGVYILTVIDNYNNILTLVIEIDTALPVIILEGSATGGITGSSVTIYFDSDCIGYLTNAKGDVLRILTSGDQFTEDGTYYIKVTSVADNISTESFSIVTKIDYELSVVNGGITTGIVTLHFPEKVTLTLMRDGIEIAEAKNYSTPGLYSVEAIDIVGNKLCLSFMILPSRALRYDISIPDGMHIDSITLNASNYSVTVNENILTLIENGAYNIVFWQGKDSYILTLEVDTIAPVAIITQAGSLSAPVKILEISKTNANYVLYKNGQEINYTLGKTISASGNYRFIVTDDLGNSTEYTFKINSKMNGWAVATIIIGSMAAVAITFIIIRSRIKFSAR